MRNNMNKSKDNNLDEFKNYSKSEVKLIKFFKMESYIHLPAPDLYRMMVENAFINDIRSRYTNALRKASEAVLINMKPYRMTKEFDDLIENELNKSLCLLDIIMYAIKNKLTMSLYSEDIIDYSIRIDGNLHLMLKDTPNGTFQYEASLNELLSTNWRIHAVFK